MNWPLTEGAMAMLSMMLWTQGFLYKVRYGTARITDVLTVALCLKDREAAYQANPMLGQTANLNASHILACPFGSQRRTVSRVKIGQKKSIVVSSKKGQQESMESPAVADPSNGTMETIKEEGAKAVETQLTRSSSIPVAKRKDNIGGFGGISR